MISKLFNLISILSNFANELLYEKSLLVIIKMNLNEQMKNEAIEVMNRIMIHPISSPFRQPITQKDVPEHYFETVTKPIDLSTIKTKLLEGKYQTIQQWFDDMELTWSNAELFHGKESSFGIVAVENRRLFNKEKKKLFGQSIDQWCGLVYELRSEITDLMNQPPSKVKQFADTLGAARSMKPNQQVMSEREKQCFIKASEMLTSEDEHKKIIGIISETQPELDNGNSELYIDVAKLNRNTAIAIKDYMKTALENDGKKYPDSI